MNHHERVLCEFMNRKRIDWKKIWDDFDDWYAKGFSIQSENFYLSCQEKIGELVSAELASDTLVAELVEALNYQLTARSTKCDCSVCESHIELIKKAKECAKP